MLATTKSLIGSFERVSNDSFLNIGRSHFDNHYSELVLVLLRWDVSDVAVFMCLNFFLSTFFQWLDMRFKFQAQLTSDLQRIPATQTFFK